MLIEYAACNHDAAPQNDVFASLSSWTTTKPCPHYSSILYVYGLMYPGNFDATKRAECMHLLLKGSSAAIHAVSKGSSSASDE
jgi:hypothetical protein